jgi:hypothetical protein
MTDIKVNQSTADGAAIGTIFGQIATGLTQASALLGSPGTIANQTKAARLEYNIFVDENLSGEPVLENIPPICHKWYIAQIMTVMHLSRLVTSGVKVADILSPITGLTTVQARAQSRRFGLMRAASGGGRRKDDWRDRLDDDQYQRVQEQEMFDHFNKLVDSKNKIEQTVKDAEAKAADDKYQRESSQITINSVEVGKNLISHIGELLEVKMTHPENASHQITVPLYVSMRPSVMKAEVAPRFIDLGVTRSFWERWTMWRHGEISFFKELLGMQDILKERRQAFHDEETRQAFANFRDLLDQKDVGYFGPLLHAFATGKVKASGNLANTVMIFSADTVEQARLESGINIYKNMQRYFDQTYSMMVIIVDPSHRRVQIFINGIKGDINLSYDQLKPSGKGGSIDLDDMIKAITAGNMGRMR